MVDSPFADLQAIIAEELTRTGYPAFLAPGGVLAARLIGGVDLLAHSPKDAVRNDAGRPIFIVHGTADKRINVHHARELEALAKDTGANLRVWYVDGAGHVASVFIKPDEYEQKMVAFFKQALASK